MNPLGMIRTYLAPFMGFGSDPDLPSYLDLGPVQSLCTFFGTVEFCLTLAASIMPAGLPCMGMMGLGPCCWGSCLCESWYMIGSQLPVPCSSLTIKNLSDFSVIFSSSGMSILTCGDVNIVWKSRTLKGQCYFHNHAYHYFCLCDYGYFQRTVHKYTKIFFPRSSQLLFIYEASHMHCYWFSPPHFITLSFFITRVSL